MFEEIDPNSNMRVFVEQAMIYGCGVKKPKQETRV